MRIIGLLIAFALLAVGLYRAFVSDRPRARIAPPVPAPEPTEPPASDRAPAAPAGVAEATPAPPSSRPEPASSPRPPVDGARARPEGRDPAVDVAPKAAEGEAASRPPKVHTDDGDEDITIITLAPSPQIVAAMNAVATKAASPISTPPPPRVEEFAAKPVDSARARPEGRDAPVSEPQPPAIEPPPDDEDEENSTPSAVPIVYDEDAAVDEPTRVNALILISAASQTDQGRRRKRNEDSMLVLEGHHLYVVADGMGGHAGGDVASRMAVETIGEAFKKNLFVGDPYPDVPRRGGELALAIQMANKAIYDHARANAAYQGMGTTVVSARFSPNKQRLYVGHVGDSRCYRLRGKVLTQITTDHTMGAQGVTGPLAAHLNRAVGVTPGVKVDLIIARPRPEDVYLLCSDGLTKMVADADIQQILLDEPDLEKAVQALVGRANARGGRDNITVVVVQVKDPKGLASYIQQTTHAAS